MALRTGSWGTPEFGITEKIQSLFAPQKSYTSSGGSNLFSSSSANNTTTSVPVPNAYSYQTSSPGVSQPVTQPSGSILGASTSGGTDQQQQAPMEPAPDGTEINWDEIYAPAFDALNQAEQGLQSSYQAGLGEATSGTASRKANLASEEQARMENFGQQRTGETKRTEGAISEARRMASQLLQGLQSQYGGSTGTGAFRGEQIGAAATQNIAGNRAALQTALTGIASSETALQQKVLQLQNEEDRGLEQAKLQLRANLDRELGAIASERGKLSVDKGLQRADALQNYRAALADVEARNTQFKQQLYVQAQQQAQKLSTLKQSAQEKYSANLKAANLTNGQQITVGNKVYQPMPTSSGDIQYLEGSVNQVEGDYDGDGVPDYLNG